MHGFLGEEASRDLGGFLNPRLVAVAFGEISDDGEFLRGEHRHDSIEVERVVLCQAFCRIVSAIAEGE